MDDFHVPVMLRETIHGLRVKRNGLYIDATVGGGGHTGEIINQGGRVLAIDQDEDAILHIKKKFEAEIKDERLIVEIGNFAEIGKIAEKNGVENTDGILFDLGVSSYQIDKSGRGFSFRRTERLDMRMSRETDLKALDVVNKFAEEELYNIFSKYGEERKSRAVAKKIVDTRQSSPIKTSEELGNLVLSVIAQNGEIHPATRIFQALRIFVNDELNVLKIGLRDGFKLLNGGSRMAVISFHSLEDRIVKLFAIEMERSGQGRIITKKPIVSTSEEIEKNRRARSAKLRIIEKI